MLNKHSKKAEISLQMIILAILGLVTLVILIFVFKDQIGNVSQKYFGIVNQTEAESKGDICETMFGGRRCQTSCDEPGSDKPYIYDLGTGYKDCKAGEKCCASESGT